MATTVLDAGRNNLASFVEHHEDVDISLNATLNGFCRVELACLVQLADVLANLLGPAGSPGSWLVCRGRWRTLLLGWSRGGRPFAA